MNKYFAKGMLTESNIQRILSEYMQPSNSSMSRRTSHTYDIVNKENTDPFDTTDASERFQISPFFSDAAKDYQSVCEQKQMMIEDLNGHLVQRAELIGQREDMDLMLEQHQRNSHFEYEFAINWEDFHQKGQTIQRKIVDLSKQLDLLITKKANISNMMAKQHTETLGLAYIDISNQIGHIQNKIANEQKHYNSVLNEQDNMNLSLVRQIQESTKQAFQEYLYNQQSTFKKLKDCYGQGLFQQILNEHREQLESLLTSQYKEKILQIQQMQHSYNKVQQLISQNIIFVDNFLSVDIANIHQQMELKRDVMRKLQAQQKHTQNPMKSLKKKVEELELEKLQLEQQVIEMTLQMETQQKRKHRQPSNYNQNKTTEQKKQINVEERSPVQKQTSSQKKRRSYSEINQNRQNYLAQRFLETSQPSDNNSQIQSFDLSHLRASDWLEKACQISSDDSLLQHIHELDQTIQEMPSTKKTLNMPLQLRQSSSIDDEVRLQTITEEQLSTNREEEARKLKFKQNQIQIEDQNNTTKKHTYLSQHFSQPSTNKAAQNLNFIKRDQWQTSDQVMKTQKSRSVDYSRYFSQTQKTPELMRKKQKPELLPLEQDVLKIVKSYLQQKVKPLINQVEIFKKFTNQTSLKKDEYNPYVSQNPGQLGYGLRIMQLSQNLDALEFRNPLKQQVVETSIKLDQIVRSQMVQVPRRVNTFIWMSIITQRQGRVELMSPNENLIQQWFQGLQFLKDNLKLIQQIRRKLSKL